MTSSLVPGIGCHFGFLLVVFLGFDRLLIKQVIEDIDIGLDIIVDGYIVNFVFCFFLFFCCIIADILVFSVRF